MLETIILFCVLLLCIVLIYYMYQGPAFVPSLAKTVDLMVSEIPIRPSMAVADLGSGDGRIVIAFAKAGARAYGFEINPLLVWYSRWRIKNAKLQDKASISTSNFWQQNLGNYEIVTIFGINHVMERLESKILAEMKPDSVVISNAFRFRNLHLDKMKGSLLFYRV